MRHSTGVEQARLSVPSISATSSSSDGEARASARRPFRVFGYRSSAAVLRRAAPFLPGLAARTEHRSERVSLLWVQRSRCAVLTTLRFFTFSPDRNHSQVFNPKLSPGFALLSEFVRANPSRPAEAWHGSSHGLCFPTAHQDAKIHQQRVLPTRCASVFRVWLPS